MKWPVVGDRVEVFGTHRGWVLTSPVIEVLPDGGFRVAHPDNDTAVLTVRPDGKVPWRWPADDKLRKSDARRALAVLDALSVDLRQSCDRETDQITQLRLYAAAAGLALAHRELAQIIEGT